MSDIVGSLGRAATETAFIISLRKLCEEYRAEIHADDHCMTVYIDGHLDGEDWVPRFEFSLGNRIGRE